MSSLSFEITYIANILFTNALSIRHTRVVKHSSQVNHVIQLLFNFVVSLFVLLAIITECNASIASLSMQDLFITLVFGNTHLWPDILNEHTDINIRHIKSLHQSTFIRIFKEISLRDTFIVCFALAVVQIIWMAVSVYLIKPFLEEEFSPCHANWQTTNCWQL